ncbi:unnamed protein product [Arctia plantaginis]|uniref:TIL domain-containing protein n=1 Tax=Arctia plantaginis TaxID=874455 RepID=A0A8S1BHW9_ARCPL|nr:unnamed protein product [Arctia plantaginis]CAB3260270.1 unnamed protein product [Arctia plantaginis]
MNFLIVTIISLVPYSYAELDFGHRCLLFMGSCVDHCPRMMHPYNTRCDGDTVSQRTCSNPEVRILGFTCGWSRCDCNGDLLLDEENGLCVPFKQCTTPFNPRFRPRPGSDRHQPPTNTRIKIPSHGIEDDRTTL